MKQPHAYLPPVLATLLILGCQAGDPPPPPVRSVLVQTAAPAVADGASFSGEIRARHESDLAFRVGGKLIARLVDNGAEIKAGQPLARLDPNDLQLAADSARAQLTAAESEFATARAEKERYAGLLTRRFVSQAAFDAKDNAFKVAQGRLEQARSQSQISGNQAHYGTLSSDFAGVVTAVLAEPGQVVATGQPVLRVARPDEREVAVAIPESRITEIRQARQFSVTLWAAPQLKLAAELRELAAAADPATRTYAARFRLLSPPPEARLGMSARVNIGAAGGDGLQVPLSAVTDNGRGPYVRIVQDGKVVSRPVQVARFREDGATLTGGLKAGELVIVSGVSQLVDGQSVQPVTATPPGQQR